MTSSIHAPMQAAVPKRIISVINGGANRGARENLQTFARYNEASSHAVIVPTYVDPAPGRALAMRESAALRGVTAHAVEARVEELVASRDVDPDAPVVLNLDRASAVANSLRSLGGRGRAVLGYLLIKLPSGRLWATRFALEPQDALGRQAAIAFFERLAEVSERGSSASVVGATSDPAHRLLEPVIRRWFSIHCEQNLGRLAAGIEPIASTFEVTTNGRDAQSLHLVVAAEWSDPGVLAEAVLANPDSPIRRGSSFVIAEITSGGVRFHEVRRRRDGRVTVREPAAADGAATTGDDSHPSAGFRAVGRGLASSASDAGVDPSEAARDLGTIVVAVAVSLARASEERAARRAIQRAERETLSKRNPVQTTD